METNKNIGYFNRTLPKTYLDNFDAIQEYALHDTFLKKFMWDRVATVPGYVCDSQRDFQYCFVPPLKRTITKAEINRTPLRAFLEFRPDLNDKERFLDKGIDPTGKTIWEWPKTKSIVSKDGPTGWLQRRDEIGETIEQMLRDVADSLKSKDIKQTGPSLGAISFAACRYFLKYIASPSEIFGGKIPTKYILDFEKEDTPREVQKKLTLFFPTADLKTQDLMNYIKEFSEDVSFTLEATLTVSSARKLVGFKRPNFATLEETEIATFLTSDLMSFHKK